jgi:hypothetical protein
MTDDQWVELFRLERPIASARCCVGCGHLGCRVGVTEDDVPEADVLCTGCFENADTDFKLRRQWFFRACVKAGMSGLDATLATYADKLGDRDSEALS